MRMRVSVSEFVLNSINTHIHSYIYKYVLYICYSRHVWVYEYSRI